MKANILAFVSLVLFSSTAAHATPAVPPASGVACEVAAIMSCDHFAIGDAAGPRYDVFFVYNESGYKTNCDITDNDYGASCIIDTAQCPDPAPAGVSPYDIPNIAMCEGCGEYDEDGLPALSFHSISEAKCCLIHAQPTNPATGLPHC